MQDYLERLHHKKMQFYKDVYQYSTRWNGSQNLIDKTIIIYCEQGIGDTIQFCRYFPFIQCKKLILHCSKELFELFSIFTNEFIDKECNILPEHDYHILSFSLPFIFNKKDIVFPYINIGGKKDLIEYEKFYKIGIAWEGNPIHSNNNLRSCPLKHFKYLNKENVKLFMLQKEIHNKDLIKDVDFELYGWEINNFLDTAELINSMDLIISVDTSVLHLAGAMNKRSFGLLKNKHDERWNVKKWYESVTFIRGIDWDKILFEASQHIVL